MYAVRDSALNNDCSEVFQKSLQSPPEERNGRWLDSRYPEEPADGVTKSHEKRRS